MTKARILGILAAIIALAALVAACSSGDDNKSSATGTPTVRASQTGATSTTAAVSGQPSKSATSASTTTATTGAGNPGNGNAPVEACDLMTMDDVASVLNEPASDFENDSLGKQIPPAPFTSGVQCQYNNVSNLTDMAWLNASFAPSSAVDQIKQALKTECNGQGTVSGLGDLACFPQYAGQLKVVKGSTLLDFFLYANGASLDAEQSGMKTLAQKAVDRLP